MTQQPDIKFRYELTDPTCSVPNGSELYRVAKEMKELTKGSKRSSQHSRLSITSEHSGNVSIRTSHGFAISCTGQPIDELDDATMSCIRHFDERSQLFRCHGRTTPSSETPFHYLIYKRRKDVNVILHAHDDNVVARANLGIIPLTDKEYVYGTWEIAEAACDVLKASDFVVLKNHGLIAVGPDIPSAWKTFKEYHSFALTIV